jgi:hypothetical protein
MRTFLYKSILYVLLVLCLTAVVIHVCLRCKPDYFLGVKFDYDLCNYQYRQMASKSPYRNIIIGDSRGNAAIDPTLLGKDWINLSLPGGTFFEGYLTLKRFLSMNAADTLVMVYGIDLIEAPSIWFNVRTVPFQFPTYTEVESLQALERRFHVPYLGGYPYDVHGLTLIQLERRLRYQHSPLVYQQTFLDALNRYIRPTDESSQFTHFNDHRGQLNFGNKDSSDETRFTQTMLNNAFNPNKINLCYLDSIIDLAAKNKTTVFFVMAPLNRRSYELYENSPYAKSFDHFMDSIFAIYPYMKIPAAPSHLDNRYFGDGLHLNARGTAYFTGMLRGIWNEYLFYRTFAHGDKK